MEEDEDNEEGDVEAVIAAGNFEEDGGDDLSDDLADVEKIEQKITSEKTKKKYRSLQGHFKAWLIAKGGARRLHMIGEDGNIDVEKVDSTTFLLFVRYRQKINNSGAATAKNYRSMLFDMYRTKKLVMPQDMQLRLKGFFKGLTNQHAQEKQDGTRKMGEGKREMPFDLYKSLCEHFMKEGNVFAHCYLILSWNLCCRTNNTQDLTFSRIDGCGW